MSVITQETVINLADRGVPHDSFRFGKTTMESDKFVCTSATSPEGKAQVVCIDMHDNNQETRKPTGGDAFLMNPVDNIMAVRGTSDAAPGIGVQVFDLSNKTKLGNHTFTTVVFWRWLAPRTLAIITDTSVYHWNVSSGQEPVRVFDRKETCAEPTSQIIAYTVDSNTDMTVDAAGQVSNVKWCLLTALYPGENSSIEGAMMLYSIPAGAYQKLQGHAGCFGSIQVEDNGPARELVAFFQHDAATGHKLTIMPRPQTAAASAVKKLSVPVRFESDQVGDFPVAMHMSEKLGVLFTITKHAYAYVFDIATGQLISRQKVASDAVFLTCPNNKTGGVLAVTRKGLVINVGVNEQTLIPYIKNQLGLPQIARSLALRYGYAGDDEALVDQFKTAFQQGDYRTAATVAGKLKSGALRTPHVMTQFKNAPVGADGAKPIMTYFQVLIDQGKLNRHESLEIAQMLIAQGHVQFLDKWVKEDKLELSPELADLVKPSNPQLAGEILLKAGAHTRVVQALMERGAFDQVVPYARQHNTQIDADGLLRACLTTRPDLVAPVAAELLNPDFPPIADAMTVFNLLIQSGKIVEGCGALFKYLRPNRADQGALQTRLLQVAIQHHREGAKSIFQTKALTYYDRNVIAADCERAGLIQLALEHHTDLAAIRRCMLMGGHQLTIEWLTNFLTNQSPENILEILSDMLKASKANSQIVFQAALKFHDRVGAIKFANLFESQGQTDVCYHFLKTILAGSGGVPSQDPEVHNLYIEIGCKLNQIGDVETFVRQEPALYDPVKVKNILKEARLANHRPLIHVCDRHGFIEEMTEYLYKFDDGAALPFLKVYVLQVNTQFAPRVLGTLIDLDCGEDFITDILIQLHSCPTDQLVEAFERRSRLKMLLPFLERAQATPEPAVHNALAKIYIDTNRDAETFLTNNSVYDPKVIGDYCADRDPHLACVAYKRYPGKCDDELIAVANKNGLYRMLARYCVERQDPQLWAKVLNPANNAEYREGLIESVTSTALPESSVMMEVTVAVKAFVDADIPHHLMELLEKIVLHNPAFQGDPNLQSLLILTAIKTDPSRVMDYINRLDNYEGKQIAEIAVSEKYNLFEEGFVIYQKLKMNVEAVDVLLNQIDSIPRATEFAERVDESAVWARVAKAELAQSRVTAAVDCYIRANVATDYSDVIEAAEREEAFTDLVRFCRMVREHTPLKNSDVDTALVYALARTDALTEDFFSNSSSAEVTGGAGLANLQEVGDRLFREGYFRPARLVFAAIPNNARLASCYVMLEDFPAALEAAKKAKNPKVWKEVCLACVAAGEFKLAQVAGQHVITQPDHLDELVKHYERAGYIDQLIDLLDSGLASESAHPGLFTELGILYVKHRPTKLRAFAEQNAKRLNTPKLIRACEKYGLWKDAVILHTLYGEFDQAVNVTLAHPAAAWDEAAFEAALKKVSNGELLYRAATFYLEEHPLLLSKLLIAVSAKLDHARAINVLKRGGGLNALALTAGPNGYLRHVWKKLDLNIREVNEAVIELYLEEENFSSPTDEDNDASDNAGEDANAAAGATGGLREFIAVKDNFDQVGLATRLEKHPLLAARRIATYLYRANGRFKQALELAKKDGAYKDVIDTARASGKTELVEELLRGFADSGAQECFAATLYVCYDLIKADVVEELAWRNGWESAAKPYKIQQQRELQQRLEAIEKSVAAQSKTTKMINESAAVGHVVGGNMPLPGANPIFGGQLALGGPVGGAGVPGYPPAGGFGF